MAVPFREPEVSQEEIKERVLLDSFALMAKSEAWGEMKEMMQELVEQSLNDMLKNVSPDPSVAYALQLRWQQRQTVVGLLVAMVENYVEAREKLLEELKSQEPSGETE